MRFANNRSNSRQFYMASDIKRSISNSKSLSFNLDKFLSKKSFIKCDTSWANRFMDNYEEEKAERLLNKIKHLYSIPCDNPTRRTHYGTAYENWTDAPFCGLESYLDHADTKFAVFTVPVVESNKDMGIESSCDAKCLVCDKDIILYPYDCDDYYKPIEKEYTFFNLSNKRYEVVCHDCIPSKKKKMIITDENIPSFIKGVLNAS